jgi:hypothetical protein
MKLINKNKIDNREFIVSLIAAAFFAASWFFFPWGKNDVFLVTFSTAYLIAILYFQYIFYKKNHKMLSKTLPLMLLYIVWVKLIKSDDAKIIFLSIMVVLLIANFLITGFTTKPANSNNQDIV